MHGTRKGGKSSTGVRDYASNKQGSRSTGTGSLTEKSRRWPELHAQKKKGRLQKRGDPGLINLGEKQSWLAQDSFPDLLRGGKELNNKTSSAFSKGKKRGKIPQKKIVALKRTKKGKKGPRTA